MSRAHWLGLLVVAMLLIAGRRVLGLTAGVKPGVELPDLTDPNVARIVDVASRAFAKHGLEAVITSGLEGEHMIGSLHPKGKAIDWRRWQSDAIGVTAQVVADMRQELGPRYDVILEGTHIHTEFDPT